MLGQLREEVQAILNRAGFEGELIVHSGFAYSSNGMTILIPGKIQTVLGVPVTWPWLYGYVGLHYTMGSSFPQMHVWRLRNKSKFKRQRKYRVGGKNGLHDKFQR